jgi:hypothetical protein
MQKSNWKEFDFKIASDYTHGSPEQYRTMLRHMLGLPVLLPGEKKNGISQKRNHKTDSSKLSRKRDM